MACQSWGLDPETMIFSFLEFQFKYHHRTGCSLLDLALVTG